VPKIVNISPDRLEAIRAKLLAAPDPVHKDLNRRDAIKAMAKELQELQNRGYTLTELAAMLKTEGIEVSAPTLKTYITDATAKAPTKPTKPTKKVVDAPCAMAGNGYLQPFHSGVVAPQGANTTTGGIGIGLQVTLLYDHVLSLQVAVMLPVKPGATLPVVFDAPCAMAGMG